jgi:hypothetical protein
MTEPHKIEPEPTDSLDQKTEVSKHRITLPVSSAKGGVRPGIDLNDSKSLFELLDEEDFY